MPCASVVRLALPEDRPQLLELCHSLRDENALMSMDEARLEQMIDRALERRGGIVGVIGPQGAIEASVYMLISQMWYSPEHHLEELWSYVHPDHRRSDHAKALIDFAKECSEQIGIPLIIGILSTHRTEAKVRLYRRRLGVPAGAFFLHTPKKQAA